MKKLLAALLFSLLAVPGWSQTYFNIFGPANGVQYNTGATPFNTAATALQLASPFGCGGSSSLFLNGAGGCTVPAGTGVSSVTVPAPLTATGCTGGSCAITWTTGQTANRVLASPNGTTGAVSLRALVAADLPTLVAGSTTNIQYNAGSGVFGGASNFTYTSGTGDVAITAPTSGVAFTVSGLAAQTALSLVSGSTSTSATQDLAVSRAGSTVNSIQEGPNLTLIDSTNSNNVEIQESGNQFEFWKLHSGSWTQEAYFGTTDGMVLNGATGGDKGAGTINTKGVYINGAAVSAGGTPGGISTEIQYNNSGAFGGANNFFYQSTGDVQIAAPTSGTAFAASGVSGSDVALFTSASGAGTAQQDVEIDRAGSTVNVFGKGPNIQLNDTVNSGISTIQQSGGQTEFWQKIAGSENQVMRVAPTGGFIVGSSSLTDEGSGTINVPLGYYYNNIKMPRSVSWSGNCTSGGCTVTQSFGINTSVTRNSVGNYTVTFSSTFGTAPSCTTSSFNAGGTGTGASFGSATTSTAVITVFTTSTGALVDSGFSVICAGL